MLKCPEKVAEESSVKKAAETTNEDIQLQSDFIRRTIIEHMHGSPRDIALLLRL